MCVNTSSPLPVSHEGKEEGVESDGLGLPVKRRKLRDLILINKDNHKYLKFLSFYFHENKYFSKEIHIQF